MRGVPYPADCQASDGARQLERRYLESALSDGYGNRLARVPLLPVVAQLPFGRRHSTDGFVRQVDACLLPQSRLVRVESNVVDARLVADVIEVDIAGLLDSAVQGDRAMRTPAPVRMPEENRRSGAMERSVFVDAAAL